MRWVYKFALPGVKKELGGWRERAARIPDPELRTQALASIADKEFHCQGGSVYAAINSDKKDVLIPLIVALQTISDYLDNLCDRSTSLDPEDFRLLHKSMLDAVDPSAQPENYYRFRDEQEDGGYLNALVTTCQENIRQLPGYVHAQPYVRLLVSLYGDLQVYKHIAPELREPSLTTWRQEHAELAPELYWNEFSAATGSTLGMFMLFAGASRDDFDAEAAKLVYTSYFPYVCGLHIMLDYLIDQEEDRIGGDLNFCNYYDSSEDMLRRVEEIVNGARRDVAALPHAPFHRMVIEGLIALYLSDPKVSQQQDVRNVSKRLMKKSPLTRMFFFANSVWIRKHKQH
ncbi:tetraprenyl-beta-curcumene synthase family protein [Saccharibacillus sp. JS10]|uniref:tetraprenyl-beta-curcumene synthase family protein n=1 Tax=Saccharibacillus sp. JS10 TaxID=2950552 RepID=UPI00210BFC3D|nr:tetraprenyl-beta-curcumene synthase family protein [Saccharibacillus sp. JS10]MCQ4087010.1 tetraprenyl-beta-curcumene synthase family protein [Saccharibacillus sp. JS10]